MLRILSNRWPKRNRLSLPGGIVPGYPKTLDPLDFLTAEATGVTTRDAFQQIHSVIHGSIEEVERAVQLVFEQLRPEGAVADRVILEANGEIRNELARASFLADERKDTLVRDIHARLEKPFSSKR